MVKCRAGGEVFGRAEVLLELLSLGDAIVNDHVGTELAQVVVEIRAVFHRPPGGPIPVEPHDGRIVAVDQLLELGLHISDIGLLVAHGRLIGRLLRDLRGMMPINDRVVGAERDAVFLTGRLQLTEYVAVKVRRLAEVILGVVAVPEAKALVVLGRDDHILHAGILGALYPSVGIQGVGTEIRGERDIFLRFNFAPALDPFGIAADLFALPFAAQGRIHTIVNKEAEFGVSEPLHAFLIRRIAFRNDFIGLANGLAREQAG